MFIPARNIPAEERDRLRSADPSDPNIKFMSQNIKKMVNEQHRPTKWLNHLDKAEFNGNNNNLWRTIKKHLEAKKKNR